VGAGSLRANSKNTKDRPNKLRCVFHFTHTTERVRGTAECSTDRACALNEKFGKVTNQSGEE